MDPIMFITPLAAVILGNGMTFAFLYCMWLLKRDASDWKAIVGALFIMGACLLVFLSIPR